MKHYDNDSIEKNRKNKILAVTAVLVVCVLCGFGMVSHHVTSLESRQCLSELEKSAGRLTTEIRNQIYNDYNTLDFTADVMANSPEMTEEQRLYYLKKSCSGIFEDVSVLLPNNTVFTDEGIKTSNIEFSEVLNAEEKGNVACFIPSITEKGKNDIYSVVKVKKPDGKIIGLLCGTIDLQGFVENYLKDTYSGKADVYITDGNNDDFVVNTWKEHVAEKRSSRSERKTKRGFDYNKAIEDMKEGKSGYLICKSTTSNQYYYMRYEPVGIGNMSLMMSVPESTAFANVNSIKRTLYLSAAMVFALCIAYFAYILICERSEKKKNMYMLKIEKTLFSSLTDNKNIYTALKLVTRLFNAKDSIFISIKNSAAEYVYIGDGRKIEFSEWDNGIKESILKIIENYRDVIRGTWVTNKVNAENINKIGFAATLDYNNEIIGIICTANPKKIYFNYNVLEEISIAFSMALQNAAYIETIEKMGTVDSLTGIMNRNSYQSLEDLNSGGSDNISACIYADADGLHTLNNSKGHEEGDKLLKCIAKSMSDRFGMRNTYRIGGDEFISVAYGMTEAEITQRVREAIQDVISSGYHMSVGIGLNRGNYSLEKMKKYAEQRMYENKFLYHHTQDAERRNVMKDKDVQKISVDKDVSEIFLSAVSYNYSGVYILDHETDEVKIVYVPEHFKKTLDKHNNKFRPSMKEYISNFVDGECSRKLNSFLDYTIVEKLLSSGNTLTYVYRKINGDKIRLTVSRSLNYSDNYRESVWIFEKV